MKKRVLVLGAGFAGLELSTMLSEAFGDGVDVALIDKGDAFSFGFSKLDVMFGRTTLDAVRLPYRITTPFMANKRINPSAEFTHAGSLQLLSHASQQPIHFFTVGVNRVRL